MHSKPVGLATRSEAAKNIHSDGTGEGEKPYKRKVIFLVDYIPYYGFCGYFSFLILLLSLSQ